MHKMHKDEMTRGTTLIQLFSFLGLSFLEKPNKLLPKA